MANKDDGPAFPGTTSQPNERGVFYPVHHQGMSLRDWFAGQVACGMAAFSGTAGVSYGPRDIAGRSYEVADAMLAARSNGEG